MDNEEIDDSALLSLPTEIQLLILAYLEVPDILKIRQTCRILSKVTHERTLWLGILSSQVPHLPLPLTFLHSHETNNHDHDDSLLYTHSTEEIEFVVRKTLMTEQAWYRPREGPLRKLRRENVGSLFIGLEIIDERWLLVVYAEGAMYLYDSKQEAQVQESSEKKEDPVLRAILILNASQAWSSYATAVDMTGENLVVAVSQSRMPFAVHVYEVDLAHLASSTGVIRGAFTLARTMAPPSNRIVRALDISQRLIVLSNSRMVEVVRWDVDCSDEDNAGGEAVIRIHPEDLEDLWNGVIGARFMGPYILIFKTRTLELHRYNSLVDPSVEDHPLPPSSVLKAAFSLTFRDVSFSDYHASRNEIFQTETFETTLFAYDVIHGLFHYVVRLTLSLSSALDIPPPALEVRLTGVYPLAIGLSTSNLYGPSPSRGVSNHLYPKDSKNHPSVPELNELNPSPTPVFSHTHFLSSFPGIAANGGPNQEFRFGQGHLGHPMAQNPSSSQGTSSNERQRQIQSHSQSQLEGSSRGFVSAHRMGSQGKRAVWVERKRSNTAREVQVWSRHPGVWAEDNFRDTDGSFLHEESQMPIEFDKVVVFSVHSYDLRDDVTYCTFGEVSGTIVLGHRSGDVSVLDLTTRLHDI